LDMSTLLSPRNTAIITRKKNEIPKTLSFTNNYNAEITFLLTKKKWIDVFLNCDTTYLIANKTAQYII
jgi:hypothetical protein